LFVRRLACEQLEGPSEDYVEKEMLTAAHKTRT
jgi:hypothetical protein